MLSMLDVPMPKDDDMSEDKFEGYLDYDPTAGGDNSHDPCDDVQESSMNSPQPDDDAGCTPIPKFEQPVGCAEDMTGPSPLQYFEQMVTKEMLEKTVEQTNRYAQQYMKNTTPPTFLSTWLEQSNV